MATKISSTGEWDRALSSHSVVIADFYADWCGPCKQIAPIFESLATKHSKPGRILFAKVDTDSQGDIAQRFSVRAMPTFKLFHKGTVVETVQGANPPSLTAAVEKVVKLAGPTAGAGFSGSGRKLGGTPVSSSPVGGSARRVGGGGGGGAPWRFDPVRFFALLRNFVALYFISLFSIDPYKAAEQSAFNVNNAERMANGAGYRTVGGSGGEPVRPPQERPRFQTLADL